MNNLIKINSEYALAASKKVLESYQGLELIEYLIPYDRNFATKRYFVEYTEVDGSITDIGNYDSVDKARTVFVNTIRKLVE